LLGQRQNVQRVSPAERFQLAAGLQALQGVLPDRLQHAESPLARRPRSRLKQPVVDERPEALHRRQPPRRPSPGDRVRPVRRAPAHEDPEAAEEDGIRGLEQRLAPGDRLPQGALTRRGVSGPSGEHGQGRRQQGQQLLRRQVAQAGGGELEG
jgi:hypothetical protein